MTIHPFPQCPSDATLAAFVDGDLEPGTRRSTLAHLERCDDCLGAVLSANAQLAEERALATPRHASRWWLAAAAAAVLAVLALPLWLRFGRSPIHRLVALAPHTARVVEPRLSGGFAWAAYAGANRAANPASDQSQLRLGGAAAEILERAEGDRGSDAQHAAGVALLLVQQPADAIARLEAATSNTNDAKAWSDLAAARYAAASQLGRATLYPTALAAADRALRLDPNLGEALFNRALILDRLGLLDDAKHAWQAFLAVDPSSPWATEARSRIAQLPAPVRPAQFDRDRPLLEDAAQRGEAATVRRYVDANRERARFWAETEVLGQWGEALQRNDEAAAVRALTVARDVGDAVFALYGEGQLRDVVRTIDQASPAGRRNLAAAHALYRSARATVDRDRAAGVRDLGRAAQMFDEAHDPLALRARFFAVSARLEASDTAGARAELESLLAAVNAHPDYITLGAAVRWELGRALSNDNDWAQAATVFADGAALFRRAGERSREGFTQTMVAFALTSLGRNDEAWLARVQGFSALSAEGDPARLATSVAVAVVAELAAGHRDAALALAGTEAAVGHDPARPQTAIKGLVSRALLQSLTGDTTAALQTAQRAERLAQQVADPQTRESWIAQVAVARGAALAESNARAASEALTKSIDYYTARNMPGAMLDPLLLRARSAVRTGDTASARRDLERGMAIVASHPAGAPGGAGWSVLDAEHAVFTDAIRLALERGDKAAAFAFAEQSHGTPATLPELQQRLAGSSTALLELVPLSDELVTFAVTANDFAVVRRQAASSTLASLAEESLTEEGTSAAAKLYDELIRPAERTLERASAIVIVADARLTTVPYAALYDSVHRRFLVERFAVSMASSAGSLQVASARNASPTIATVALPSGGGESTGLPDVENEVHEVSGLYARATPAPPAATFAQLCATAGGADVIHIAGHTERQTGAGEQALLFASASGKPERVSWKTIAATPALPHGVIVLAACETLRPPPSTATHALSLGAAFSAAGASDVVGTLAPIGDRDARLLFRALHRQLAAGVPPAQALQAVQQEAIANEKTNGGRRAWRAVALWTRRISAPGERKESTLWAN